VHLRILSYNIHRAIGVDRRFRLDRIVAIIASHDPDVALLQEVDDGVPRSKHLNLAVELSEALDYPYVAVGHNVRLRRGRYGNATLSRFPILRERNIDLTVGWRKPRGCQHATLRLEKPHAHVREVEVFNLHLGLSARERARQIGLLVRSNEFARSGPERPCVVGGDFNDWRNILVPIFTEVLGFHCATARGAGGDGHIRTYPSFSPTGGLDKIFVRGPVRLQRAWAGRARLARVASDHLPVVVDVRLG